MFSVLRFIFCQPFSEFETQCYKATVTIISCFRITQSNKTNGHLKQLRI